MRHRIGVEADGAPESDMTAEDALQPLSESEFDSAWYLMSNPDVRAAGVDPWEHYSTHGYREGRAGAPLRALELDHILWRGFAREAEAELRLLLRGDNTRERALAGWVLGRYAAAQGKWRVAKAAIRWFHASPGAAQSIPHPGPWLLGVQANARLGDLDAARNLLSRARERFGDTADLGLAQIEIALAQGDGDRDIARCLSALHAGTGLAPLDLQAAGQTRFDRLGVTEPSAQITDGPLVSVVVPAHDAESSIGTCLRGLQAQSWRNLEIIVVDDCSSDRTAAIAGAQADRDSRFRVIRHERNGGAYVARNTGMAAASGAFVTVHDADDWSHPQKIELQVRALLERTELAATVSHWARTDEDLHMTRWRMEDGWIYRNVSSLMLRAELREKLGYWDRVRVNADTEYYHRVEAVFGEDAIAEVCPGVPMAFGRSGADNLTTRKGTHLSTQFVGPRRSYMEAARDWHARQLKALPQDCERDARARAVQLAHVPSQRPFHAPPEIGPVDPADPDDAYAKVAGSPYLDVAWYLRRHSDVLQADADPVLHYLYHGAREDRDPGPLFSTSAWRCMAPAQADLAPLAGSDAQIRHGVAPVTLAGAIAAGDRPVILVFAHEAHREIFGAERSFLTSLERLAQGEDGAAKAPVVVLPMGINPDYVEMVRERAVAVVVLPQVWRHRFRAPPVETIDAIRGLIRAHRPAEVHVNTIVLDTPLIAARLEGIPAVIHVRELPPQDPALCRLLGNSAHGLRRQILAEADRFIANSHAVADWLGQPDRTRVWHNRIDPRLHDLPFAPSDRLRVGLVSNNLAKKGIGDFVDIARKVSQMEESHGLPHHRRCRFLLIGPATADLAALGALPPNTEYRGYAPDPLAAMRQCDVVLMLSHFAESFGRTALEALAAGRPVVSYDRGTPPSFIAQGETGFVVPFGDRDGVAEAIAVLALARNRLARMSAAARNSVR